MPSKHLPWVRFPVGARCVFVLKSSPLPLQYRTTYAIFFDNIVYLDIPTYLPTYVLYVQLLRCRRDETEEKNLNAYEFTYIRTDIDFLIPNKILYVHYNTVRYDKILQYSQKSTNTSTYVRMDIQFIITVLVPVLPYSFVLSENGFVRTYVRFVRGIFCKEGKNITCPDNVVKSNKREKKYGWG